MNLSILNTVSGSIHLGDDFLVSKGTNEAQLVRHFNLEQSISHAGWKYYTVQNLHLGNLFFIFTFSFLEQELKTISFILDKEAIIASDSSTNDWAYSTTELDKMDLYEEWLNAQLGTERDFSWGKIEAMFHKRTGGPMIQLEYA